MKQAIFQFPLTALTLAACLFVATACSDDDETAAPLTDPASLSIANVEATSLTFSWSDVPNAIEYYCVLMKDGNVSKETSVKTSAVTFSDLTPSTTYVLYVTAYAAIGSKDYVESGTTRFEGRTGDPVPLTTIVASSVEPVIDKYNATITWEAVPNAASYDYALMMAEEVIEEGNVTEPSVTFTNLEPADYTMSITAKSDEVAFVDSEPVTISFTVEKPQVTEWKGSFCINADWDEGITIDGTADDVVAKKLVINEDGSYTLLNAYDGVDVTFTIDADGYVTFTNAYSKSSIYNYYYGTDNVCIILYDGGYAYGDLSDPDDLYVYWYAYNYSTYAQTIDFFTYTTGQYVGMFYYQEDTTADPEYLWKKLATMTDNGDGTYTFKNLYADGYDFSFSLESDGKVNIENAYYSSSGYDYVHVSENSYDFCCYTASTTYGIGYVTDEYISVWWSRYDYREDSNGLWGADYFYIGEWE